VRGDGGGPRRGNGGPSTSTSTLSARITLLEKELQESHHARAELEQKLAEERRRSVADRDQLAGLLARIEQLEGSREVNAALMEDNRFLRAELEAEKLQVQESAKQLERLRGETPPPTVVLSTAHQQLLQENAKLRGDLQASQQMLAKYTEELQLIMPDVELILNQWKVDNNIKGPEESLRRVAESNIVSGMPLGASSSTDGLGTSDGSDRQAFSLGRSQTSSLSSRPQRPKSPTSRPKSPTSRIDTGLNAAGQVARPKSSSRTGSSMAGTRTSTSPQPPRAGQGRSVCRPGRF